MDIPRPEKILREISARYPDAWRTVEKFRAARGRELPYWPSWCFVPMAAGYAIVSAQTGFEKIPPSRLDLILDVSIVTAMAAWRLTKGIYRFDPDLFQAVAGTVLNKNLPSEVFFRLPEWCVYLETPGLSCGTAPLHGFFAHLEWDVKNCRTELRLLLDLEDGLLALPLHLGDWPLAEAMDRVLSEAERFGAGLSAWRSQAREIARQYLAPLVSLLLYLCAANADLQGERTAPKLPQPVKTKKGMRYFPADKPHLWEVGVRLGAALRLAAQREREEAANPTAYTMARKPPRPHIRRAHWHGFWRGPRKVEERQFSLIWLPPIPVKLKRPEELPVTIRPVK